jgi:hypothetical protein
MAKGRRKRIKSIVLVFPALSFILFACWLINVAKILHGDYVYCSRGLIASICEWDTKLFTQI